MQVWCVMTENIREATAKYKKAMIVLGRRQVKRYLKWLRDNNPLCCPVCRAKPTLHTLDDGRKIYNCSTYDCCTPGYRDLEWMETEEKAILEWNDAVGGVP